MNAFTEHAECAELRSSERSTIAFINGPLPLDEVAGSAGFSMAGYLVTKNVLEGLVREGMDVSLVTAIAPMPAWPKSKVLFARGARRVLENGTPVERVGFPNVTPFKQLWVGLLVAGRLIGWAWVHRKRAIRVVLCYNMSVPPLVFVWIAARITRSRLAILAYDVDIPGVTVPDSVWRRLDYRETKALLPRVDGIIGVTERIRQDLAPRVAGICIPVGVEDQLIERFRGPRECLRTRARRIVFAGALSPSNGIELLLEALRSAPDLDICLELIGDGPLLARVRDAAAGDSRIVAPGRLPYDEVLSAYASADAIVCIRLQRLLRTPYLFPSKLVEAMGTGIPLVCTLPDNACSGIRMVVENYALVVEQEDSACVLNALMKLSTEDETTLLQRAAALRSWTVEHLSWRVQCQRIAEFIDGL